MTVIHGTSQTVDRLFPGEFAITAADGAAHAAPRLSYPIQCSFGQHIEPPYNNPWFPVPPGMPSGQQPKLGILHPSLMRRSEASYRAAMTRAGF